MTMEELREIEDRWGSNDGVRRLAAEVRHLRAGLLMIRGQAKSCGTQNDSAVYVQTMIGIHLDARRLTA